MNIDSALQYPFKSIAKVLTIVLIFATGFAFLLAMLLNSIDFMAYMQAAAYYIEYEFMPALDPPSGMFVPAIIGLVILLLVQGFWISGYGISVIRHILEGYEKLPEFDFGKNMMDGLALFFASIWYGLAYLPIMFVFMIILGMTSANDGTAGLAVVTFCAGIIAVIPFTALMGWAYFVGMARTAVDNDRSALFQIPTNFGIARKNVKACLTLMGFQILLAIIFGIASQGINWLLEFVSDIFVGNSVDNNTFLVIVIISLTVTFTVNVIQQFSSLHILAQFAENIGVMVGYEDIFEDKKRH